MNSSPSQPLKIVLIRHAEKPEKGDNLSPQGLRRALQLPAVLYGKFGVPGQLYVPALALGITTAHSRMFQTATPFAVQYNLPINTNFAEKDFAGITGDLSGLKGTALVIWEHHGINDLVREMGIVDDPIWADDDYDSIWIVTFSESGKPVLSIDRQNLNATPAP